jgi:tetratricopeptide (TPR) repeat protein
MISEVKELLDLFPYFQSAHLLLLKGLNGTGDVKFESQLKQSAIHIADREVLYYLLKNSTTQVQEKYEENISVPDVVADTPDNLQVVIESGKNSEELINELEKSAVETVQGENSANTSSIVGGHTMLVTAESETDESASVVFLFDSDSEIIEESVTYLDPSFSFPERSDLLELDDEKTNTREVAGSEELEEEFPGGIKDSKKQSQASLIDKFIIANPRIEPVREKPEHPIEDISKPFVEESGGFVTETLARIYINQGYYSKAIDIYEKLSLKYPEKSSYFATQIEKIKALIK